MIRYVICLKGAIEALDDLAEAWSSAGLAALAEEAIEACSKVAEAYEAAEAAIEMARTWWTDHPDDCSDPDGPLYAWQSVAAEAAAALEDILVRMDTIQDLVVADPLDDVMSLIRFSLDQADAAEAAAAEAIADAMQDYPD